MEDVKITPKLVKDMGLTEEEFDMIKEKIGKTPNFTELGLFSAMWSEHCSYKTSKPVFIVRTSNLAGRQGARTQVYLENIWSLPDVAGL